MRDVREGLDLEHSSIPWYYGWTANISLPTEGYFAAGGFDTTLTGWGFEDVDLSYRLFKHGLRFAFVPDGWSLELPQTRQPLQERLASGQRNMRQCYTKQRTLALESLLLAALLLQQALAMYRALPTTTPDSLAVLAQHMRSHFQFLEHAEAILSYLSQLGHERKTRPPSADLCGQGRPSDAVHRRHGPGCDSLWVCHSGGRKPYLDCRPLVLLRHSAASDRSVAGDCGRL